MSCTCTSDTQISPQMLAMIEDWEGLELAAYQDIAGIWTIGYGHTGGVALGQVITSAMASALLRSDLAIFEMAVSAYTLNASPTQPQFDAMVSLAFNIGAGAFKTSSVLRYHLLGMTQQAADSFLLWDKAHVNGQLRVVAGLLRRRQGERAFYLSLPS